MRKFDQPGGAVLPITVPAGMRDKGLLAKSTPVTSPVASGLLWALTYSPVAGVARNGLASPRSTAQQPPREHHTVSKPPTTPRPKSRTTNRRPETMRRPPGSGNRRNTLSGLDFDA